jgi:transcriptional regulator with XRE-family HTH domain
MTAAVTLVEALDVAAAEDSIVEALRERLRVVAERKGLPRTEWARLAGLSPGTLTKLMRGETKEPSIVNVIKLADVAGVDRGWLCAGPDVKTPVLVDDVTAVERKGAIVPRAKKSPEREDAQRWKHEADMLRRKLEALEVRYAERAAEPPLEIHDSPRHVPPTPSKRHAAVRDKSRRTT